MEAIDYSHFPLEIKKTIEYIQQEVLTLLTRDKSFSQARISPRLLVTKGGSGYTNWAYKEITFKPDQVAYQLEFIYNRMSSLKSVQKKLTPIAVVEFSSLKAIATMRRSSYDTAPTKVYSNNFNPKIIDSDWLVYRLRLQKIVNEYLVEYNDIKKF